MNHPSKKSHPGDDYVPDWVWEALIVAIVGIGLLLSSAGAGQFPGILI